METSVEAYTTSMEAYTTSVEVSTDSMKISRTLSSPMEIFGTSVKTSNMNGRFM